MNQQTKEQSPPTEVNIRSTNQETSRLWNPNAHYRVHNSPPCPKFCFTFRNGKELLTIALYQGEGSSLVGCPGLHVRIFASSFYSRNTSPPSAMMQQAW
jgi:hypothetical protein